MFKMTKEAILDFYCCYEHKYTVFDLTEVEYNLFSKEIENYNSWIENILSKGLSPPSSYSDKERPYSLLVASGIYEGTDVLPESTNRGDYLFYNENLYNFQLYWLDDFKEEYPDVFEDWKSNEFGKAELKETIIKPLDAYDTFSMGYFLLPVTRKLLG